MQTSRMTGQKRVLSIQSEVAAGHVGNSAARFVLQRMGIDVVALPTVLFSNHPGHGGFRGQAIPAVDLAGLIEGLDERGFLAGVDAVISGYLGSAEQAGIVADAVRLVKRQNGDVLYLLDPVFGDDSGAYARPGVADAMRQDLLPLSDIVAPNRFELASLSGRAVIDDRSAVAAARSLGRTLVLATSIPCGEAIGTAVVTAQTAFLASAPRLASAPSGTGDTLAAMFLGRLLQGCDPEAALGLAASAIDRLISNSARRKDIALVRHQAMLTAEDRLPVEVID